MAEVRQFRQDTQIIHGTTAQNNAKLTDIMPLQHEDLATQTNQMKKISLGQCLCEPFAVCNSNNPANGAYVADCVNFPDFTLQFTDGQGNNHSLIGLKVRVLFNYGITYGSVSGGTYPTLNINGSGAIPLLAQGKTMGVGAISAGQTVEFTIIPYGNSLAFDADSNVREANSDYTVYTDGSITYTNSGTLKAIGWSTTNITSMTPFTMRELRYAVTGESRTATSMLVIARVANSYDYWIGTVSWQENGATEGGEGTVFNTISNKGLELQYINSQGNVAFTEVCSLIGKAI